MHHLRSWKVLTFKTSHHIHFMTIHLIRLCSIDDVSWVVWTFFCLLFFKLSDTPFSFWVLGGLLSPSPSFLPLSPSSWTWNFKSILLLVSFQNSYKQLVSLREHVYRVGILVAPQEVTPIHGHGNFFRGGAGPQFFPGRGHDFST